MYHAHHSVYQLQGLRQRRQQLPRNNTQVNQTKERTPYADEKRKGFYVCVQQCLIL